MEGVRGGEQTDKQQEQNKPEQNSAPQQVHLHPGQRIPSVWVGATRDHIHIFFLLLSSLASSMMLSLAVHSQLVKHLDPGCNPTLPTTIREQIEFD